MAVIVKRNSVIVMISFGIVGHDSGDYEGADEDGSCKEETHHQSPGMS